MCQRILLLWLTAILFFPLQTLQAAPPVQEAATADLSDALLIYTSEAEQAVENAFRRVVSFYGLTLAQINLAETPLTQETLRDEEGACYPTVLLAGTTLAALDAEELDLLRSAIVEDRCNVMVTTVHEENAALAALTGGAIGGGTALSEPYQQYVVTSEDPAVTREFSGMTIDVSVDEGGEASSAYALALPADAGDVKRLVEGVDTSGESHPLFVAAQTDGGQIFASSETTDDKLRYNPLHENYYANERFAQIVPMMMFVRYTAGEEAWHRNQDFANLTIDDPPLSSDFLDYEAVLAEAKEHNFHLTIAMPPTLAKNSQAEVVQLFRENPESLSVVLHGNNHDGYEFYRYETEEGDEHRARPLSEHESDLVEGLTRMEAFSQRTGIPYGRVMIFPFGIAPAPTLGLLKQYNYLATINGGEVPLGETREWSGGMTTPMRPADLSFNSFASIKRNPVGWGYTAFDLFLDKPAFLYQHTGLFADGADGFNQHADAINQLHGEVTWLGLDEILKRLYLQKRNDDGSYDVMFYTNHLILTNDSEQARRYHLRREETENVAIRSVTVDGEEIPYTVADGQMQIDLEIPAGASRQIQIQYAPVERDFAIAGDVTVDLKSGEVRATVRNNAAESGPVTVGFWTSQPAADQPPAALATVPQVEAGGTAVVTATLPSIEGNSEVIVSVDPYNVIGESDKQNNQVLVAIGPSGVASVVAPEQTESEQGQSQAVQEEPAQEDPGDDRAQTEENATRAVAASAQVTEQPTQDEPQQEAEERGDSLGRSILTLLDILLTFNQ